MGERFGRARALLRARGVEVTRYPHPHSLAARTRDVLRARGVDLVVDVGANRGQYVSFLRDQVGYAGRVVCFEPVAACFAELSARTAGDPSVECRERALGARSGTATMHVSQASDLSSFLPRSAYGGAVFADGFAPAGEEEVVVSTLDAELAGLPSGATTFLKLDTQGFDLDVLAGGERLLPRVAAIQLEMSQLPIYEGMPPMEDALRAVRAHGFEVVGFFPVTTDADGLRVIEFDVLACRR